MEDKKNKMCKDLKKYLKKNLNFIIMQVQEDLFPP